jgi:esterase/lipase superfamily enzyme
MRRRPGRPGGVQNPGIAGTAYGAIRDDSGERGGQHCKQENGEGDMYVITNRQLHRQKAGLAIFGSKPNTEKGPKEIRVVECSKDAAGGWQTKLLDDIVAPDRAKELLNSLRITPGEKVYQSVNVAWQVFRQAQAERRNILLFVHGYNNDVGDALETGLALEKLYNIIPIVYSWPADGGGIAGTASYLSDRQDAQISAPAFSRVLEKVNSLMLKFTRLGLDRLEPQLKGLRSERRPGSPAYAEERNRMLEELCSVRLTLLTHSMGNYLLKKALETHANAAFTNAFDNVVLAAADTNNIKHEEWVDTLAARRRIYITINENDYALAASQLKPGENQLARLGNCRRRLTSQIARYIDFTDAGMVDRSHGYFKDKAVENAAVHDFFDKAFNGREAEGGLEYSIADRLYRVR